MRVAHWLHGRAWTATSVFCSACIPPSVPVSLGVPLEGTGELGIALAAPDGALGEIDPVSQIGELGVGQVLPIGKSCDRFAKESARRVSADLSAAGVLGDRHWFGAGQV